MTTFSTSLRLWEGTPGDPAIRNVWGTALNTNDNLIEAAILGTAVVSINGLTAYTLTVANGAADQARPLIQQYTGALTGDCTVTLPAVPKISWAQNITTGGHNVILTTGTGLTITIPPDGKLWRYQSDGTNVLLPGVAFGGGAKASGSGSWSSSNWGKQLIITTPTGFSNPAIALTDANGVNLWGFANSSGALQIAAMPAYSDSTSPPNIIISATTSGVVFSVPAVLNGGALLANNTPIQAKDAGAVTRNLMLMGTDSNTYLVVGSGGSLQIVDPGQTTRLFECDAVGNVTIIGVATVAGSSVVTNNGATYNINISGNAAAATTAVTATNATNATNAAFATNAGSANAVAWTNVTGKPYAFNQSADVGANMIFGTMGLSGGLSVGGVCQILGGVGTSGSGWFATASGASSGAWSVNISLSTTNGIASQGFFTSSDRRLKENIRDISAEEGEDWIRAGRPRLFYIGGKLTAGFIAQEDIDAGRGEAVISLPDSDIRVADGDGYAPDGHRLSRNYEHDIAYLTAAVRALLDRVDVLERGGR